MGPPHILKRRKGQTAMAAVAAAAAAACRITSQASVKYLGGLTLGGVATVTLYNKWSCRCSILLLTLKGGSVGTRAGPLITSKIPLAPESTSTSRTMTLPFSLRCLPHARNFAIAALTYARTWSVLSVTVI